MKAKLDRSSIFIILVSIALISCENNSSNKKDNLKQTIEIRKSKTESKKIKSSNYDLLQGKWVSEDDSSNFLVFENNIRREIAGGMENWDEEEFILSDKCENEPDDLNTTDSESYISCKKSNLCWYILSVSDETLTLQYLGRGNTLEYIRVKE